MNLQELREQKARLAADANAVLTKCAEDKRSALTADEEQKFDAIHVDIEKLTKQIERLERQDAVNASLAESQGKRSLSNQATQSATSKGSVSHQPGQVESGELLRSWLLPASQRTDEMRARATRYGVSLDAPEFTFKLSPYALRSTSADDIATWKRQNEEFRAAMGTTSGAVGGYSIPDATMQALEIALLAFGGMRGVSTILRTDSGAALPFPMSNDTSNKGAILTENTQVSEVDIVMTQMVLDAYMYSSKLVLVSLQLLQDTSVNVSEMIGRMLGERIGRIQNDHFTTGTGSSQPNGAVTAATDSTVTAASSTLYTYEELLDVQHAVNPAYRGNARWMLNDTTLKNIKKIKVLQYSGDVTGMPLWQPSMQLGAPDTIMGYPYTINQSMGSPATTVKSVLFGDFSKYHIRDVRDVTLVRLNERYADYHQVGFLAFARSDGDLLDAGTHPLVWADHT